MAFDGRDFEPIAGYKSKTVVVKLRKDRVPLIVGLLLFSYLLVFFIGFFIAKIVSPKHYTEFASQNQTISTNNQIVSSQPETEGNLSLENNEYVIKVEEGNKTVIPVEREHVSISSTSKKNSYKVSTSNKNYETKSSPKTTKRTTKATKTTKRTTTKKAKVVSGFSIQIASFKSKTSALNLVKKLQKRGYPAYYKKAVLSGGTYWRVRVGPFSSMALAIKTRSSLSQEGYKDSFIVKDKVVK